MSSDKTDLTFLQIAERLAAADLPDPSDVDAVVGIARGGVVPAALVAYELKRPLRRMQLSFRDDLNRPQHDTPATVGDVPDVAGQRVLLVDDVSVTGATLKQAAALLNAQTVTTMAFKGKPGAADMVLFPDMPKCVRWPWFEDVAPTVTQQAHAPQALIVAGVSGSGKSTVGRMLAERLGWRYVEADDHHPPANVAKMRRGEPLTDEDRAPWLDALKQELHRSLDAGQGIVLSSSALKARYRHHLTEGRDGIQIVLLHGSAQLIADRLNARTGHFFDPKLLQNQLDTLELPGPEENLTVVDIEPTPEAITENVLTACHLNPAARAKSASAKETHL